MLDSRICCTGTAVHLTKNNEFVQDKSSFAGAHACPVLLDGAAESVVSDASARASLMAEIKEACRGQDYFTADKMKCCWRGNNRDFETSLAWGVVLWWVGDAAANCICSAQF